MATPVNFTVRDASGNLDPGATPSFASADHYTTRAGVNRTAPSISGSAGRFSFLPTDADEAVGVVYLITTGASPDYLSGAVTTPDKDFAVFLFRTAAGALISSGTPTTALYKDFALTNTDPPTLVAAKPYLWTLTPTVSDIEIGVTYSVVAPAAAIPDAYDGELYNGNFTAPVPSSVAPVVGNFQPSLDTALQPNEQVSIDVTVADGTALANVSISVVFGGLETSEDVFDGYEFSTIYAASSYVLNITNGHRYVLKRRGGWPASPQLKIRAVTVTGKLNA